MAFIIKDRVKEGTTTAGTGALTLSGASATFDPFSSYMANGDTTYYAIVHTASGVDEWEVGIGTWNTGNILTRTTVLSGSNGASAEDFSEGSKDVFMTYPASKALFMDAAGDVALGSDLDVSGSLDVGESIEVETHIDLKTTTNNKPSHAEGRIFYDAAFGALAVYNDEADITLQVGQEEYIRIKNNTGSTISNGTPVYLTGEEGSTPTVAVARADGNYNASQAVGIATHDIETNSVGYVTVRGLIADVDTSHLTVGEKVHVAIGASGGTQTASPTYPNYPTEVGVCLISSASGGCIYVYTQTEALESLRVTGNSHFDANVTIDGDLTVLGNQTIASTSNVSIANAWNYFNSGDTIGALNTAFTGSGLDDASLTGHFTGTSTTNYYIRIDSEGGGTNGVDTFEWSTDNFSTFVAQNVDITGTDQLIHSTDNIAIKFNATTGHTLGDVWTGTGSPINVDTGFASNRNTGTSGIGYTHLGIFYDVSTNKWTVFDEYFPEPEGTIDVGHSSFSYGTLKAGTFEGDLDGDVTGDLTGNSSGQHNGSVVGNVTGDLVGDVTGDVTGNADTATALETARTIQLTGDVTGSVSFDGSANASITATVQDDSHSHVISNVDGLQTALDAKAPTARIVTAGNGLTGGGDLTANRTLNVGAGSGITVSADTVSHSDTSSQASSNNSGRTYIQDVTLDTFGHVTGLATATETVTDTTYSAGAGLNLSGTVFSHTDTSSQASVNNSDGTVIQDITLDTYGHITAIASTNLDGRFVNASGDTMTGNLALNQNELRLDAYTDPNHFLKKIYTGYSTVTVDGPQLQGHQGGELTTNLGGNNWAMRWDNSGQTHTRGNAYVSNGQRVFADNYHPNADKWTTARTLTLSGDASGSVSWDGSSNATLSVTVADDSHNHTIANVDGLQTALDGKLSTSGKAADSDLFDGLNSTSFLRSDLNDSHTGTLTLAVLNIGNELRIPSGSSLTDVSLTGSGDEDTGFNWSGSGAVNYVSDGVLKYNLNNVWHSGNDGSGSGLDADTLDGAHMSTTRNSANTIPQRDGNGYLNLGWINTTSGNTTGTLSDIYVNTSDGYIRKATTAHFRSQVTNGYYSKISGLAYGPWITTTSGTNSQNNYVAAVADDNNWMFVKVHVGTYTTGAGTLDSPTVTMYRYRKAYRTFS